MIVLLLIFIQGGLKLSDGMRKYTFWLLLFLFGIFWVTVVTNSFPMLWQMSTYQTVGIYTGLYYFFSQLASIVSPPLAGACIDGFGYRSLFIYGCVSMLVAFFLMAKVNKGEPEDKEAEHGISVPDFVAFNITYGLLSGSLMAFVELTSVFAQIKPAFELGKPLMDEVPELTSGKQFVEHLAGKVEVNNISFKYPDQNTKILDNLSLSIQPGQYVAFVGKTGCGKSTLIKLLLGFGKPQDGAIYYDGKDINTLDLPSLRSHIGVVLQNGKLFSGDILSNITIMDNRITEDQVWQAAEVAGIAEDIKRMYWEPELLIIDETSTALSFEGRVFLYRMLEEQKKNNRSVLFISHDLDEMCQQCDKLTVLRDGVIIGTLDKSEYEQNMRSSVIPWPAAWYAWPG